MSNSFRYVGKYGVQTDGDDLLFMRARYYKPSVGRFINKDPIGLRGGINLYGYVGGNPIRFVDPSGLFWNLNGNLHDAVDIIATGGDIVVIGGVIVAIGTGTAALPAVAIGGSVIVLIEAGRYVGHGVISLIEGFCEEDPDKLDEAERDFIQGIALPPGVPIEIFE
ncbi:MAG: RHS repeat-associated core domain-containing protein [Candidatus Omnitrophica bacterium]|nr:RHS repeat-associated core domain-containing protein [Candidatus Omnitrophota bacterium]